jgi:DNA-binding CsgD family transcriptional regulator
VATERDRSRCRGSLQALADASLDADALRHEAVALLQRTIGFDRWCWPLADPEALIPLSGLAQHDYGPSVPRVLELEFSGLDVAAMDDVARRGSPVGALSRETGGDLSRSPRWDEVLRLLGIGDEAVLACRDRLGCWGWLKAYRDRSDRAFSPDELVLLADVAAALGRGLRRAHGRTASAPPPVSSSAGVVALDDRLAPVSTTAAAREWMSALPGAAAYAAFGMLPAMVYPVAMRARRGEVARVLERTVEGRWVLIEAAMLDGAGAGADAVAVTFRSPTPAETFDRLSRIYGLTPRERDIAAAVAAGHDTAAMSALLSISPLTVQDHLKAIFDKTGVRSRAALASRFASPAG